MTLQRSGRDPDRQQPVAGNLFFAVDSSLDPAEDPDSAGPYSLNVTGSFGNPSITPTEHADPYAHGILATDRNALEHPDAHPDADEDRDPRR